VPQRAERREDSTVRIDLEVAGPDVGQPADRLQGNQACVAQHDEPAQPTGRPMDERLAAISTKSVRDTEAATPDVDIQAIAGKDEDATWWPSVRNATRSMSVCQMGPDSGSALHMASGSIGRRC
jgi:hypothetical protein